MFARQFTRFSFFALLVVALAACSPKEKKPAITNDAVPTASRAAGNIYHKIDVQITPSTHMLTATDTVTIPASLAKDGLRMAINTDLTIEKTAGDVNFKLVAQNRNANDLGMDRDNDRKDNDNEDTVVKVNIYELTGFEANKPATISFTLSGKINNEIKQLGVEYSRGFSSSPGLIEQRGVYLAGATYWIPTVADILITYDLTVTLPKGWSSVSQGERQQNQDVGDVHIDKWSAPTPSEEIYVIGAQFTQYELPISTADGNVTAMAYLRTPDAAMANKYLEVTAQYMEMYNQMLGPYPYTKFALVENFWETGYGMPSFTLLGSQIIRFPFILHSSYPHELLHNWWGNSVYIDFDSGNWAEGLTAYMADHLVAEQRGTGAQYRRATLQAYTNYVDDSTDFALRSFLGRTDSATQAVGYGKTSQVFDMLRQQVGDEDFLRSFQNFYSKHKYKIGRWDDIRTAFEDVTGPFFTQWVDGVGAPELAIENVSQAGETLTLTLTQKQQRDAFTLQVPVVIYSKDSVLRHNVQMTKRQQVFSLPLKDKVVRVEVDPEFNLFRRLHSAEIPPSLGAAFGADKVMIVLPTRTTPQLSSRYSKLAALWSGRENVTIVTDSELSILPQDGAVWVFGANNKYYGVVKHSLEAYGASVANNNAVLGDKTLSLTENSTIIVVRNPQNPGAVVVGLTAHSDAAVAGLARKLPHYGKYSYLAFNGGDPTNSAKGQWPAVGSPLAAVLDSSVTTTAKLKPRPALAQLKPVFDGRRMMGVVKTLASKTYEGRGVGTKGLDKAADYIARELKAAGLKPGGEDGTYFQTFTVKGEGGKSVEVRNVVGIIPGNKPELAGQSVVLSAHYDHLGHGWPGARDAFKGQIHPGADDNASGVAVMLEMAHALAKSAPDRTIIFLASTAEEAGLLGARHYVKTAKDYPADKIFANVNLDTVGRAEGKIMIFGASSAREWPFIFMGTTATTGIQTVLAQQEVNASDHTAFLEANIPAIHIFGAATTDYHRPSDTAKTIDPSSLVRVATLTKEVVAYLGTRPDPMTNQIKPTSGKAAPTRPTTGRRVSTGMMPDFAHAGAGVLVKMVSDGSAGAKAGLQEGDIITHFGGAPVKDLRVYSGELKKFSPGDKVEIIVERAGETMKLELVLGTR